MNSYQSFLVNSNNGDGTSNLYRFEYAPDTPGLSEPTVHLLSYAPEDGGWTVGCAGDTAVRVKDTGNNLKIKIADGPKFKLDYAQAHELRIMLDMLNRADENFVAVETVYREED